MKFLTDEFLHASNKFLVPWILFFLYFGLFISASLTFKYAARWKIVSILYLSKIKLKFFLFLMSLFIKIAFLLINFLWPDLNYQ